MLQLLTATATLKEEAPGSLVFEAEISSCFAVALCQWDSYCEDCEDGFDREEDRTLPWLPERCGGAEG